MSYAHATKKQKASPLRVYYFDIPGKAEAIRTACVYGGLDWEDVRISRDEFAAMKASGKLAFGQLPALGVIDPTSGEEIMLFQSAAIIRYVGKLAGLYPANDDILAARIDALLDQENDLFAGLTASRYRERYGFGFMKEDDVTACRKALNDDVLPRHLGFFEKHLEASSTGWLLGGVAPTIADFVMSPRLDWLSAPGLHEGISEHILDGFPKTKALIEKVRQLPAVAEYYKSKA